MVEKNTISVVEKPTAVVVPVKPNETAKGSTHIVVKGDTLYSLSKKYAISIEELKKKNGILENGISIGQELIIQ